MIRMMMRRCRKKVDRLGVLAAQVETLTSIVIELLKRMRQMSEEQKQAFADLTAKVDTVVSTVAQVKTDVTQLHSDFLALLANTGDSVPAVDIKALTDRLGTVVDDLTALDGVAKDETPPTPAAPVDTGASGGSDAGGSTDDGGSGNEAA